MASLALETLASAADPEWEDVLFIDVVLLNKMAKWLIAKQDVKTGAFLGSQEFYDLKMRVSNQSCFSLLSFGSEIIAKLFTI